MDKLKFYEVDKKYIEYLKRFEGKIPNISYEKHDKFICGILLKVNGMNYYAPVSSFKKQQRTNFLLKNKEGEVTSSIRLSFMFPVPDDKVKEYDFSKEKGFYKYLLLEEIAYCNKQIEAILDKADYIYRSVVHNKNPLMIQNCCDFAKLEYVYEQYMSQCKAMQAPNPRREAEDEEELEP